MDGARHGRASTSAPSSSWNQEWHLDGRALASDAAEVQDVADFRRRRLKRVSSCIERDGARASRQSPDAPMGSWRRCLSRALFGLSLPFASSLPLACSGVDPNAKITSPPLPDEAGGADGTAASKEAGVDGGGSSSGTGGGSGSGGGPCSSCAVDNDCQTGCGPTKQSGYLWCCAPGGACYQWSTTCPGASGPPGPASDAGGG